MPGRGPAPKEDGDRRRANAPERGWQYAPAVGWRFGEIPKPPAKMTKAARDAWATWFAAWFAAFWTAEDLPGLRTLVRLYDQVERGEFQRAGELRLQMDTYGITPKGQQDRRWRPPVPEEATENRVPRRSRYAHLRDVSAS